MQPPICFKIKATVKEDKLPVESLWSRRSGLLSLAVIIVVSALGIVLDRLLLKEGLPRLDMMIFSNGLTGLFAGGLFYQMAREARTSRTLVEERMKTIAELNHHIRNALQVIKFLGGQRSGLDAVQLQLINDSADRIEWALREVLPRYSVGAVPVPEEEGHANVIRPVS
jgi:two-component sensor histidine kinase